MSDVTAPAPQRRAGLPVEFARAPMRTVRPADAQGIYAYPGTQLARLQRLGLLHKVAIGYYVVVPPEHVQTDWRPSIEAAAAGIAVAAVGIERAVLMGVSAARIHNAIPRALGTAIVAVPDDRRDVMLRDRVGKVHFVQREVDRLDAELVSTELGQCLVTTTEQTVLDLAHRPTLGDATNDVYEAIETLLPRCDESRLESLAAEQRLMAALRRVRATKQ